jgi:hypothetical protein
MLDFPVIVTSLSKTALRTRDASVSKKPPLRKSSIALSS